MSYQADGFIRLINTHRGGALADELSRMLHNCTTAARDTGKMAEITLTLKLKPTGSTGTQLTITDNLKPKIPQPDRDMTLMFIDADGNLTRRDPRQSELDGIRRIPDADEPLKKVDVN